MFSKFSRLAYCSIAIATIALSSSLVQAQSEDLARYFFRAFNVKGVEIDPNTELGPNQTFTLVSYVRDLRATPKGVFAAYLDVTFDPVLVTPIGPIDDSQSIFPGLRNGTVGNGIIDEVGGIEDNLSFTFIEVGEVFRIQMRTTSASGHIKFKSEEVDNQIQRATLLYDIDDRLQRCELQLWRFGLRAAPCDFNLDGDCDSDDIDLLTGQGNLSTGVNVNPGNIQYDLNGDGTLDRDDIRAWLAEAGCANNLDLPYIEGDINLDGFVDGLDFVIWNANKFTTNDKWSCGDLNGDGFVDGLDFIIWNANKFTSSNIGCSN